MKIETKLGRIDVERTETEYKLDINKSTSKKVRDSFMKLEAEQWVKFLERLKASSMEGMDLSTRPNAINVNTDGDCIIISCERQEDLVLLLNTIADITAVEVE
jgi:hypothetical protein